ncbi:MAG: hypothetical protein RIC30_13850 [Marinoscillum sp.]|uniref:hypothetical protein n=1 Tax=Marinoscillum sp. TaxID=2024838 RepID=UPI0032F2086E
MRVLLVLSLLITSTLHAQAQSDYLVTSSKDTLRGKVSLLLQEKLTEKVTVTTEDETRTFHSGQLIAARINEVTYKSIKHGDKYRMMKEITPGYLGLYSFRFEDNYDFDPKFLYKVTGEGQEIPTFGFRAVAADFLSECPSIVQAIKDKTYKISELSTLVDDYNTRCLNTRMKSKGAEVKEINTLLDQIAELQQLLRDIQAKKDAGEKIPQYMIKALEAHANHNLSGDLNLLLEQLTQ